MIGETGCGAGGVSRPQRHGMVEELDPFHYGDEFETPSSGVDRRGLVEDMRKGNASPESTRVGTGKPVPAVKPPTSERSLPSAPEETESRGEGAVYRVQIGVFEDQKAAEARAAEARAKVSGNVYVEFEPPFYRVRVGDFKTRKDAESYVKILQNDGFRGAFWVLKQATVP
jgi:cell division protein FtsN